MSEYRQFYNYATETLELLGPDFVMTAAVAECFVPSPPSCTRRTHRMLIASLRHKIMNGMGPELALQEVKRRWLEEVLPTFEEGE